MSMAASAVLNNQGWCALVSASGGEVRAAGSVWLDAAPPWPYFPDAVTLSPDVPPPAVANLLADRLACSVKDSYADVDLAAYGFKVLLQARWMGRSAVRGLHPPGWSCVTDEDGLAAWSSAAGLPRTLPHHLLSNPTVRILAADKGNTFTAGALAYDGAGVVGLSNVFHTPAHDGPPWPDLAVLAGLHFPGRPLVGYEAGQDLAAAMDAGFVNLGPVRIWVRR